jgi:hypothetical protein
MQVTKPLLSTWRKYHGPFLRTSRQIWVETIGVSAQAIWHQIFVIRSRGHHRILTVK